MDKTRLVRCRRQHHLPHLDPHRPPEERRKILLETFINRIDDLVDDSLEFIDEELCRSGLDVCMREDTKKRFMHGLLSVWVLESFQPTYDRRLRQYEDVRPMAEYFTRKFGRKFPWPLRRVSHARQVEMPVSL